MSSQTIPKPRVYGEETEYGSVLIDNNGKAHRLRRHLLEQIVNRAAVCCDFIANGGRIYDDQGHIEYATPECICVSDVVRYSKAGEHILNKLAIYFTENIKQRSSGRAQDRVRFFRHNADTHRQRDFKNSAQRTFGCHENYSFDPQKLNRPSEDPHSSLTAMSPTQYAVLGPPAPSTPLAVSLVVLYNHILPFLVSRFIWQGNGNLVYQEGKQVYQLSQRIPHLQVLANTNTIRMRSIFNWRNEPNSNVVGRLHVTCGDANMSEFQTYLKFGTTGIVMSMIEDGYAFDHLHFQDSILALHTLNQRMNVRERCPMAIGEPKSHLQIQNEYLKQAQAWARSKHDQDDEITNIIQLWEETLTMLEENDPVLEQRLDWIAKRALISARASDRSCQAETLDQINLQYHDINPQKGLYYLLTQRGRMETFLPQQSIVDATIHAPEGSRAKTRQAVLEYLEHCRGNGIMIEADGIYWNCIYLTFLKNGITHERRLELPTPYDTTDDSINRINQFITKCRHRRA